jgi:AraC family transcriptional regulator
VKTVAARHYQERMRRVLDHIEGNLDGDLDLAVLSGVAAFSKHHFQRQFSEYFGLTPHRYVQLARLKRASHQLAYRGADSILHLAMDSGYESAEAFARVFKERFGQTPGEFRERPDWGPWTAAGAPLHQARNILMTDYNPGDVRIVDFPATPVALLEHKGDPTRIGDSIRTFIGWRKQASLPPRTSATFNILHNDPDTTAADEYRLDICAATSRPVAANEVGVVEGLIPEGRCAVLRMTGSSDDLRPAVSYLYRDWLPDSGEELRDFPMFAQRVSFFPDVAENEAITDIFLPLK